MKGFWRNAIVASCILALVAGCSHSKKDEPQQTEHVQAVGAEGKNLKFPEGVEVAVPKGAVATDTHLTVTNPATSPLPLPGVANTAVRFDVSLEQDGKSGIQPLQPLTLSVDLTGAWIPNGAKPQDAKVYTPIDGRLWIVPSKVEGTKLTMSLGHLSPKYITYISDADLVKSFDASRVKKDPGSCSQQIAVTDGKVKFGPTSRGWSTKSDSPLLACLSKDSEGNVHVGIVNQIGYVLSVAAHADVHIAESTGDAETEMIKAVTRRLFPNEKVKALVGEGDTIVGSVRIDDLPSTIEAVADPSTFYADSIMRLLGLTIGALTGKTAIADNLETIGKLLNSIDVITCLQGVVKDIGGDLNMGKIASIGSKCIVPIMDALGKLFDLGNVWAKAAFVVDALKGIYDTAVAAWNGIRLTIGNTMRVSIVAEMEAKFTNYFNFRGFRMPIYSHWKVEFDPNPGVFFATVFDMSTCKTTSGSGWKQCAYIVVGPDIPAVSDVKYWRDYCGSAELTTQNIAGRSTRVLTTAGPCQYDHQTYYQMQLWEMAGGGQHISYTIPRKGAEMKGLDKAFAVATWQK